MRYIEFSLPVATRNAIAANRPQLKKKKLGADCDILKCNWLKMFELSKPLSM